MHVPRRFTADGTDPFASIAFAARSSRIVNPDGTVVFEMKEVMVPEEWSQVAVDILAQKYFRKAGVPKKTDTVAGARRAQVVAARQADGGRGTDARDRRPASVSPSGGLLDLLGLERRLLLQRGRCPNLL